MKPGAKFRPGLRKYNVKIPNVGIGHVGKVTKGNA